MRIDCEFCGCCCRGCHSDEATRDRVEGSSEALTDLVRTGRLVVAADHVTYVANDISTVSVPVQCPPNWAQVAIDNETWCSTYEYASIFTVRLLVTN